MMIARQFDVLVNKPQRRLGAPGDSKIIFIYQRPVGSWLGPGGGGSGLHSVTKTPADPLHAKNYRL